MRISEHIREPDFNDINASAPMVHFPPDHKEFPGYVGSAELIGQFDAQGYREACASNAERADSQAVSTEAEVVYILAAASRLTAETAEIYPSMI